MRIAVSSLAWEPHDDAAVRTLLSHRSIRGVELAPLKYWPSLSAATPNALSVYAAEWGAAGIAIIALQGILFGFPALRLFGAPAQQAALEQHLIDMTRIAAALGASVMVLGAPRNRLRGEVPHEEAIASAAPLLRRVGAVAQDRGCVLSIEPTPPRYGGDFVRSIEEAESLVAVVDHPGIALHLDAGAMTIASEADETIRRAARDARHFHASEIDLEPLNAGTVDHQRVARLLRSGGYEHWCSVELRPVPAEALLTTIDAAIEFAQRVYGAPQSGSA